MARSVREPKDVNILVVEDERDIVEIVSHILGRKGYNVRVAYDGLQALEMAQADIDLILLDIMLPELDGFEVCRRLRKGDLTEHIPIIFFSARVEDEDRIRGLMLGGDAYLTKPVSTTVILAQVESMLRRSGIDEAHVIRTLNLTIYEDEYKASLDDQDLGLTLTEFRLLRFLVRHSEKAYERQTLLERIWGQEDYVMVTERTVDAHIKNLREKLGSFAAHVETVRGIGYRYTTTPETTSAQSLGA